jgi:hypothetical protein
MRFMQFLNEAGSGVIGASIYKHGLPEKFTTSVKVGVLAVDVEYQRDDEEVHSDGTFEISYQFSAKTIDSLNRLMTEYEDNDDVFDALSDFSIKDTLHIYLKYENAKWNVSSSIE